MGKFLAMIIWLAQDITGEDTSSCLHQLATLYCPASYSKEAGLLTDREHMLHFVFFCQYQRFTCGHSTYFLTKHL